MADELDAPTLATPDTSTAEPPAIADAAPKDVAPVQDKAEPSRPESVQESMRKALDRAKSTEPPADPTKPAPKSDAPTKQPADPAKATPAQAKAIDALEAPKSLRDELKAQWNTLPREWQQALIETNSAVGAAYNKLGKAAKSWEPIDQAWSQHRDLFGDHVRPQEVFTTMLSTVRALSSGSDQTRLEALGRLLQDFNLLPLVQRLSDGTLQAPQLPARDNALWQEMSALKAQLSQAQQADAEAVARAADAELESWIASAKPEHFDRVREVMAHLLTTGAARDYASAYEQAVWQSPELRQSLIDAQVAKQLEDARKRAEAAKAAAISPRADGLSAPQPLPRGRPETVQEAMARARADLTGA